MLGKPKEVKTPEPLENLEERFNALIVTGKIHVDCVDDVAGGIRYTIARYTTDREQAVLMGERIDQLELWDRLKSICFVNGMVDGVQTYRREIRKLGPLKMEKALKVGQLILDHIANERHKLMQ